MSAAAQALNTGFGGNLAGGTHHAFRAEGSGFCVFNDVAVAILALRRDRDIRRAAVIDLDVHQATVPPVFSSTIRKSLPSRSTARTIFPSASREAESISGWRMVPAMTNT